MIKQLATIAAIATLVFAVTAFAVSYSFNQHASVNETGTVTYYLDDTAWTSSDIDWGPIDPGETLWSPLNITNNKNIQVTTYIIVDLPSGWIETWTLNNTVIPAYTSAAGTLNLTAPVDAIAGPISIPSNIYP